MGTPPTSRGKAITAGPSGRTPTARMRRPSISNGTGDTGLPMALLDTRLYAKPEDDVDDGQYVSLLQLHLDGYILSRTGRRTDEDE